MSAFAIEEVNRLEKLVKRLLEELQIAKDGLRATADHRAKVEAENERLREAWKLASGANKAALAAAGPPPHSAIVEAMIHALVQGEEP